jgi:hypothetical protein
VAASLADADERGDPPAVIRAGQRSNSASHLPERVAKKGNDQKVQETGNKSERRLDNQHSR